jgi:hypothetical protein
MPENGDVIVREEHCEGKRTYVLRTAPGPDQIIIRTSEEATAQAVAFANLQHVRAWLIGGDGALLLLEDSRRRVPEALRASTSSPHSPPTSRHGE